MEPAQAERLASALLRRAGAADECDPVELAVLLQLQLVPSAEPYYEPPFVGFDPSNGSRQRDASLCASLAMYELRRARRHATPVAVEAVQSALLRLCKRREPAPTHLRRKGPARARETTAPRARVAHR